MPTTLVQGEMRHRQQRTHSVHIHRCLMSEVLKFIASSCDVSAGQERPDPAAAAPPGLAPVMVGRAVPSCRQEARRATTPRLLNRHPTATARHTQAAHTGTAFCLCLVNSVETGTELRSVNNFQNVGPSISPYSLLPPNPAKSPPSSPLPCPH